MILAGTEIEKEIRNGGITVSPFNPKHLNPASLDLTLGRGVAVYEDVTYLVGTKPDGTGIRPWTHTIDVRKAPKVQRFEIPDEGWIVSPGVGYLMHTVERVMTDKYVPVLDGKSSLGRLFLWVHVTAGYGDVGFNGQYTLEIVSLFPVRLYPGMRIAQMRFHTILGTPMNYQESGHYTGQSSVGAVASMAYKQFLPDT